MIHDLPLGPALRRHRRLNGIKQAHLAELLGVSQGTVSRWESGAHEPDPSARAKIARLLAARTGSRGDAALKRLVEVARTEENMIPAMLDAVRAEATLGEICDALRAEWGSYTEPARF